MIDVTLMCPECGKTGDAGKIQLDVENEKRKVECKGCHVAWTLDVPVVANPPMIARSRKDYMPHWMVELLEI